MVIVFFKSPYSLPRGRVCESVETVLALSWEFVILFYYEYVYNVP